MQLEAFSPEDLDALKKLQVPGWPDISEHFNFYLQTPFSYPYKLVNQGDIIGVGVIIYHKTSAWLASIIVHPNFRNQGLGGFITQSLLDKIDSNRYATVSLLATELGEPVYRKLGFVSEKNYFIFKTENLIASNDESTHIKAYAPEFYADILQIDKQASGEDRSALLDYSLNPKVKMYLSDNQVLGYYIPHLFDGLIVAKDKSAGIALSKLRLQKRPFVGFPENNSYMLNFLNPYSLSPLFKVARMTRGKTLDFDGMMIFSRIGGNLG